MWRRFLFFRMEALQISAGERRVILILMTLLLAATGVSVFFPGRTIYDRDYYQPVLEEFYRLAQVEEQEQEIVLARYYPLERPDTSSGETQGNAGRQQKKSSSREEGSEGDSREGRSEGDGQEGGSEDDGQEERIEDRGPDGRIEEDSRDHSEELVVHIQTASKEDLMSLPGIGPVTAERILAYREEHGPFTKPEDLLQVSGIGPVTLENIRKFLIVE